VQVSVIEARDLVVADLNGFSDPYVIMVGSGGKRYRTKFKNKTLNPKWNESFQVDFSGTTKLQLTCWDKDTVGTDDFLGAIELDIAQIQMDGTPAWFKLHPRHGKKDKVTGDILLSFVPGTAQPHEAHNAGDQKAEKKKILLP